MGLMDVIIGGLLCYGFIKGLWKGFFVELASLISLIIGIFIALKFSHLLAEILKGHVNWDPKYVSVIAFGITFAGVVLGIIIFAKLFTKLADFASLGFLNRVLGAVFGLIKMILITSIGLNFFQKINKTNIFAEKETLDSSLLYYPIIEISGTVFPYIEEWFEDDHFSIDNQEDKISYGKL